MALVRAERVLETSTTTGTGSLTLGGPVTGYRSFASVMSTSDTCYYAIVAVDSSGRPSGAWETGLATLAAATTLARTTVLASSNGGALVNLASGTKQVFLTLSAAEIDTLRSDINNKSTSSTVDVITSSMTGGSGWLLPTGAKSVHVICIGGGGGGKGGGKGANSSTDGADSRGAGGGGRIEATFPATAIGTPGTTRVNITIGAGGSSGNGATTAGSSGSDGTDGGTSSFGTLLYATGGKASVGGSVAYGGFQDSTGRLLPFNGAQGNLQITTSTIHTGGAATGGGGGGGEAQPSTAYAGTTGSPIYLRSDLTIGSDGAAGTQTSTANATAGAGGAGTSRSGSGYCGGGGGGGGGQRATTGTTGLGGNGGNGGVPGGGGGGGGPARSTSTRGGNGGAGGRGEVIVTVYY